MRQLLVSGILLAVCIGSGFVVDQEAEPSMSPFFADDSIDTCWWPESLWLVDPWFTYDPPGTVCHIQLPTSTRADSLEARIKSLERYVDWLVSEVWWMREELRREED
jgi:hypothetical protein